MLGCALTTCHHWHSAAISHLLLFNYVSINLHKDGTVVGCHPPPRPVIGDPWIRQALPDHHTVTWKNPAETEKGVTGSQHTVNEI